MIMDENIIIPEVGQESEPVQEPVSNSILRAEGLVKRYGKRTVVNDVSINVRQGEIVGLLGPNGAGKTTSFYMTLMPAGSISMIMRLPTTRCTNVRVPVSDIFLRRRVCSAN